MTNASPRAVRRDSPTASLAVPSPQPLAARPGPRLRRGRSKARAPMARKRCLLAPGGEGLKLTPPAYRKSGRLHRPGRAGCSPCR
ncbi:hypothetical protein XarbCFBP7408_15140 [Xanthomonas arboricola pv. guizotiae]|uniref:Uncharacterized protein n=1 Tax=Xanthomonas arboricola pv. guizotiae TaxID=487867 RepID=A0A2S7A198_9XANT|nr:hypothetical protein XarbCFBP7409_11185 [Xanthomonas arboricola pv. guizotiae]PPU22474.1 hypothetical protein XarbCFBP7408_15140 [Xanthomonas arboricola pv. guizotiae]